MSFCEPCPTGQQEQAAAKLPQLHAQTKRVGPLQPPQKSSMRGSGAARPMLSISIAPISALPTGGEVSQGEASGAGGSAKT